MSRGVIYHGIDMIERPGRSETEAGNNKGGICR